MAFLQSRPPREPFLRAPASVLGLIGALVLAHVARVLLADDASQRLLIDYSFIPALYSPAYLHAHGIDPGSPFGLGLRFISYLFLHADPTHLAINCAWLLAFGPVVARRYGAPLFFLFFLLCGIAGALTHLAFNWGSDNPVIGASGAISGLMAAGIRILWGAQYNREGDQQNLAPIFSGQLLLVILVWVMINVVFGAAGLGIAGEIRVIAWQAHIGGFLAGLLLAGLFDKLSRAKTGRQPLSEA